MLPFVTVANTRIYYRLEGREDLPVLVLSHSLGCDHGMWEPQVPDLLQHYRVLRYDTRGHGASDVPDGEYSPDQLGRDLLGLLDALGISTFSFCGLSMGGAVGQWMGVNAPERVTALVLANTSPHFDSAGMETRRQAVLQKGIGAVADAVIQRFFSAATLARGDAHAASVRSVLLSTNPVGYAGCCAALRDVDFVPVLEKIRTPTLVIGGDHDPSTPWAAHGELLARGIQGAQAVLLPTAHLSNLEQPRSFTAGVLNFLLSQSASPDPLDAGVKVRREVLGDDHVDRSLAGVTEFNREFQNLITRYAWGAIWARPGLDHRTRRILVVAMTASLGRWEEFRLHVHAALTHGLESCDLKEVLLQVAIYAGVPAANTAFAIAREEMEKAVKDEGSQ
jgi:3-oxoadipate enol-lactonase/4-carboxymuconolactone decarboxylase